MPTLTLDIALFIGFFVLNVIVGFKYRGKRQTFREYAIGNKKFSTAILTATIVATFVSGSALFIELEKTYSQGLYYIIATIVGINGFLLITGRVLGPRMGKFLNKVSVADALGTLYGKQVQAIAGISGVLASIGYIAVQFQVVSKILTILFSYEGPWVTIITAAVIILYATSGGVRAVTFTDVIQFATFGISLPVLALVIYQHLHAPPSQVAQVLHHNPLFSFREVIGWTPEFMGTLILMVYFLTPGLSPELFQRIVMARDVVQVKQSMTYATMICLAITLCMIWIAILLLADQPGLAPSQVVPYIVNHYTYPGLKGLLGVGVIALAMSTADSTLNACSVIIANDIVSVFRPKLKSPLKVARWATVGLGGGALLIALRELNLLDIILLFDAFYIPIAVIPMLLAIFGFETSKRVVLMAMAAGFTTVVACMAYFKSVNSFFPGMIANFIVLLGAHYLLGEEGGWGNNPLPEKLPTPVEILTGTANKKKESKLYAYLKQILPQELSTYSLLGFYILTTTYALFYLLPQEAALQYQSLYRGIQYSVLVIITSFLGAPIWPQPFQTQRFQVVVWPLCSFYALFVVGGLLLAMSGFALPHVLLIALNFVMALLLLPWPLVLGMAIVGISIAIFSFKQYAGLATLPGDVGSLQFKIIYGLLLLSSFLIALFKEKQTKAKLVEQNVALSNTHEETTGELFEAYKDSAKFARAFQKSGASNLSKLVGISKEIALETKGSNVAPAVTSRIKQLCEELTSIATQLDRLDHRATGYLRLEVATIALADLLAALQAKLQAKGLGEGIHFKKATRHQEVQCDIDRVKTLLANGIAYIRRSIGAEDPILVGLEDTQLAYPLPSVQKDYIKKIAALRFTITTAQELPPVAPYYPAQLNNTHLPVLEGMQALPLTTNRRIVSAHYGHENLAIQADHITLLYVLPVQLREVRPKDMDLSQMELGAELTRADDTYPGAQAQEKTFLAAVAQRTQADLDTVRRAIELIKTYHGPVKRKSGEPFYLHPLAVAHIVLDYNQDEATILGALLHDTVEDTPMLLENIEIMFNKEVAGIVDGVTHLDSKKDTFYKVKLSSHENVLMLLGVADQRVLYVKLADRLHNMRTIQYKPYKSQRRTSEETLQFFVPMAEQLGLQKAAAELKELCLAVLNSSDR